MGTIKTEAINKKRLRDALRSLHCVREELSEYLQKGNLNAMSKATGISTTELANYTGTKFNGITVVRLIKILNYLCGVWPRFYLDSPQFSGYVEEEAQWLKIQAKFAKPIGGTLAALLNAEQTESIDCPSFAYRLPSGELYGGRKLKADGERLRHFLAKR